MATLLLYWLSYSGLSQSRVSSCRGHSHPPCSLEILGREYALVKIPLGFRTTFHFDANGCRDRQTDRQSPHAKKGGERESAQVRETGREKEGGRGGERENVSVPESKTTKTKERGGGHVGGWQR